MFALFNLWEVIVSFGVICLAIGGICNADGALAGWQSALYFSAVTLTTTGYGDLFACSDLARGVVVAEILAGVVFALAIIPSFVSMIVARDTRLDNLPPKGGASPSHRPPP